MASKKISQLPTGSITSSLNSVSLLVTSSTTYQIPLSYLRNILVDSGSHSFTGSQTILGNLNVSGSITGQQYIISSSVINVTNYDVSGSSVFGNSFDDTHRFTGSVNVTGSLNVKGLSNITGSLFGTSSWSNNSVTSSYPISISGTTIFSTITSDNTNFSTTGSVILGDNAGHESNGSYHSNFIGVHSGFGAENSDSSNYLGHYAGYNAKNSHSSNFIGHECGYESSGSIFSNFIGCKSGYQSTNVLYSNFIGLEAGLIANGASSSNFIGFRAGMQATNSERSNFIGYQSGLFAHSASYSILIGYRTGYRIGVSNGIGSNNIIIGNNITLDNNRKNSINIGGLLFGTGSYSSISGNPFSGSANGRIGVNQPLPLYSLDVSGSGRYTNGLEVTGSLNIGSVNENLTLNIGGGGATYDFDYNSGSIFYVSASVGTNTYNITNVPTTPQKALTLTFVLEQGSTPYSASAYQFNGGAISVKWADSIIPTGSANKTDVIGLTAFRSGSSWNVLGSLTSFG